MRNIIKVISSVFYLGFFPRMPGTIASLAAFLIFYFYHEYKTFIFLLTFICGISGFAVCGKAEKIFRKKDAKVIVIDEFFAMLLTLLFVKPVFSSLAAAFIIFRIMDISKPWPIKGIEKLRGAPAVMLDDCVAAGYTILIVKFLIERCV